MEDPTMETDSAFTQIRYDKPSERIARIVLSRADKRNAQDMKMLYEINAGLDRATQDDQVRVIILAADGPDFSSGHDLTDKASRVGDYGAPVTGTGGFGLAGPEGYFAKEQEVFLGFCWRWRNLPKPVIVAVQGRAIAGGLMLIWPFDIIIASDDASFSDPVVAFGANGHEFFVHAWEVGHRKAKEMLFTGEPVSAQEARELGMVNQVVPRERLESATLEMAEKIAQRPMMGLRMSKLSVNQSLDAQGMWTAIQSAFGLHHFAHTHNQVMHGMIVDPAGIQVIRDQARKTAK
jgi:enoyl-CoA hydratase